MTRKIKLAIAAPLAVVAVIVLITVAGLAGRSGSGSDASRGDKRSTTASMSRSAQASAPEPVMDEGAAGASASSVTDYSAAVPPATVPSTHYLVRTGDMSLLVSRGALPPTVDRIRSMTAAMGGYVMSSTLGSQTDDPGPVEPMPLDSAGSSAEGASTQASVTIADPYASLVVRVPEQLFETAIKRFSKLGTVQSASTSGEDVTSQYVDLRARLRHYRTVERRLIGFLAETTNVNQMLAVQSRVDDVQLTIEELSAQIKSLRETTTYGTLSVSVSERDRTATAINAGNTFGGTLWNSLELLGRGGRLLALVLTALLPFLVVFGAMGVAIWYVALRLRRSRRRATQPTLRA